MTGCETWLNELTAEVDSFDNLISRFLPPSPRRALRPIFDDDALRGEVVADAV